MDIPEQPNRPANYLPAGYIETARIVIVTGLSPAGSEDSAFRVEGMNATTAIGHLTTTLDRIREDQKTQWRNRGDTDGDERQ